MGAQVEPEPVGGKPAVSPVRPAVNQPAVSPVRIAGAEAWMKANTKWPSVPGKVKRPAGRGKHPAPPMHVSAPAKKKKFRPTMPGVEA
jgi:hypothetical protein